MCTEIRKPSSKPFIVSTWYKPPDLTNDKFSYFEWFIGRLDSENVEYYLLGDVNCDLCASVLDHNSRSLTDIADLRPCYTVQFFMQLVSQCLKKDFDNALQEVLHAAKIFMQLATIGDRGMRRD